MELLMQLKHSLSHNSTYVIETLGVWLVFVWSHVLGMNAERPNVYDVLPYVQLISLVLASCASAYTIYKIRRDLKK